MVNKLLVYEKEIKNLIEKIKTKDEAKKILEDHRANISFFQHERLIHLLVTLFFGNIFILITAVVLIWPNVILGVLDLLILILLIPYIFHYFRLENGVQRLYLVHQQIERKLLN